MIHISADQQQLNLTSGWILTSVFLVSSPTRLIQPAVFVCIWLVSVGVSHHGFDQRHPNNGGRQRRLVAGRNTGDVQGDDGVSGLSCCVWGPQQGAAAALRR